MEHTTDTESASLDAHTAAMKSEEVAFLTMSCGWTHRAACEFVGCDVRSIGNDALPPNFLPMPEDITAMTEAIRSGELVISRSSAATWQHWREGHGDETEEADADADADALLPVVMPGWFGATG